MHILHGWVHACASCGYQLASGLVCWLTVDGSLVARGALSSLSIVGLTLQAKQTITGGYLQKREFQLTLSLYQYFIAALCITWLLPHTAHWKMLPMALTGLIKPGPHSHDNPAK